MICRRRPRSNRVKQACSWSIQYGVETESCCAPPVRTSSDRGTGHNHLRRRNGGNRLSRMPKIAAEGLARCLIYPRHNLDSSLIRRTVTAVLVPAFWALCRRRLRFRSRRRGRGHRIGHPRLGAGTPASAASNITAAAARRNPGRGIIPISGPPEIRALGT